MQAIRLGGVEVFRIEELIWENPHSFLFPTVSEADVARHMDWMAPRFFTPEGLMRLSIHAFVVKTPHHTLIVDTCVGNGRERHVPTFTGMNTPFLQRLKEQAGITPEEVDYVFCTHFHVDHVGWNVNLVDGRWEPTFPNARYLFHRAEFEYHTSLTGDDLPSFITDSVLPIAEAGLADLVEGDHRIGDHIALEPTPGHTPGHCSVRIETPQGLAVITGDIFHMPAQVAEPGWTPRVDFDPRQALRTRRDFIERHAEAGSLVLGTHFPPPTACRFVREGEGYRPRFME